MLRTVTSTFRQRLLRWHSTSPSIQEAVTPPPGRREEEEEISLNAEAEVRRLKKTQEEHLWHPMTQQRAWTMEEKPVPVPVISSQGCTLTRADGSTVIDGIAGLWCVNVGYGREELAQTAYEAMRTLPYHSPTLGSPAQIELAAKISDLLFEPDMHTYFTASGSEANEVAFKVARQYHAANGADPARGLRYKIISRYRAYHGNTSGAMAATGQAERKIGFGPDAPGFVKVPPPYPYRRHPKLTAEEHVQDVLKSLEDTIIFEGAETIAAFIMEPFISGGGVLIPTDSYLPAVRELCDKYGLLLILDEVVSGYGRTGKMFGHQHYHDSKPDIITQAKGLSSGYVPLGACTVKNDIFEKFFNNHHFSALPPRLAHLRQVNTYGGHPVACAVALKNIEIIEREQLVQRAQHVGDYFLQRLQVTIGDHPFVGDVRGKGLLLGVELVSDKDDKTPLPEPLCGQINSFCDARGVIVGRNGTTVPGLNNVLILAPPFVITHDEVDTIVNTIAQALVSISS